MISLSNRLAGKLAAATLAWVMAATLAVQPALAQSRQMQLIRDAEIEHILKTYATPILRSSGVAPEAVTMVLVKDDSLNAFVAAGQNIFWHTGLLMDTKLDELIGVMAHETGHIAGGHLARGRGAMEDASTIALLSTLIGVAAAIGSGRGDVGTAVLGGGQAVAQSSFFAFSRQQEGSADAFAMSHLENVGWSSTGLVKMMERFRDMELLPASQQAEYARTHPLSINRLEAARHFVQVESKHSETRYPAEFYDMHARMQAKLIGFIKPEQALRRFGEDASDIPSRYGRAIALYQKGHVDDALKIMDGLLKAEPENAYFHELKGQILLENGRAKEAVPAYRDSVRLLPGSGLIRAALGHALLEAQDDSLLKEAMGHLTEAARLEPRAAFAWRLLSSAYSRASMEPQLAYARAEEALARGDIRAAKFHADKAERMLPAGSPEWIRAQDIRVLVDSRPSRG